LAHKYLTRSALRWCKIPKLRSWKFLHHGRSKSDVLAGHSGKKLFFPLQRYNLTICAVKCCESFCTCSPSSLVQDPIVKSAKKWKKRVIWASWARNGRFGAFLEKGLKSKRAVPSSFFLSTSLKENKNRF
jgi:hypothetical protein